MAKVTIIGNKVKEINSNTKIFPQYLMEIFPGRIKNIINLLPWDILNGIEEIRLRLDRPITFVTEKGDLTVTDGQEITAQVELGSIFSQEDMEKILHKISQSSIYAWEEEFKRGYLTIRGGHRIGFTGKILLDKGFIRTMKEISALNIRIAKEIIGVADKVLPYIIDKEGMVRHTLIVSPPQCGKTTLLRDLIRQLSNGIPVLKVDGANVGLVDERSEIAGVFQGIPQFNVGLRTDVLDGCPKAQGMIMLVRSMSPRIIATDEIGTYDDICAIEEVLNAGISLITTVHAKDLAQLRQRPNLCKLISDRLFERIIILSRTRGVGTIEDILEGAAFDSLINKSFGGRDIS
ncbi:MAG: stage III sporulation protein AA [Bacillota bacterium]